jgi:Ribbon-helix-helix protein, copG family
MQVQLNEPLADGLSKAASRQSISVPELIERILTQYLASENDDGLGWVRATSGRLHRVWGEEDFSDWEPPRGS